MHLAILRACKWEYDVPVQQKWGKLSPEQSIKRVGKVKDISN